MSALFHSTRAFPHAAMYHPPSLRPHRTLVPHVAGEDGVIWVAACRWYLPEIRALPDLLDLIIVRSADMQAAQW